MENTDDALLASALAAEENELDEPIEYPGDALLASTLQREGSLSSMGSDEMLARDLAMIQLQAEQAGDILPLGVDLLDLPADVISQIFCEACELIPGDKEWRREFYPLWLGAMCHGWRQIAWATSELWTTIVVRPQDIKWEYMVQEDLLEEWLGRVKRRKLDVFFGNHHIDLQPIPTRLMEILLRHSEQWDNVKLHFPEGWDEILPTEQGALSLPNLRGLTYHCAGRNYYGRAPLILFSQAPVLRTLELSRVALERTTLLDLARTCKRIKNLTLSSCRGVRLQDLCQALTRLTDAKFDNTSVVFGAQQVHQRLTSLSVIHCPIDYIQYLLQLTLPALQHLELKHVATISYTRVILPFLHRSGCILLTLSLECFIDDESDLIEFLEAVPSLEELYLSDCSHAAVSTTNTLPESALDSVFFTQFHPDIEQNYLPNLTVFSYTGFLAVRAIDFLEGFIVRSRVRDKTRSRAPVMHQMAHLRRTIIRADQYSQVAEFSISEYSDPQYIWEVVSMVDEGLLVLCNMDGSHWS